QLLISDDSPTTPEWSSSFIHSENAAKKTEFFQWEKPRSIEITVELPNQAQLGEDVPLFFAMNDYGDASTPTLTLITSAEKVIPISLERDPVRSGWRATIKTIELPLGLTYLRIENGAGAEKLDYRTHFILQRATGINDVNLPHSLVLQQNYPNPFNAQTTMRIRLSAEEYLLLEIYDLKGRLVRTLVDGAYDAGEYVLTWDGRDWFGRQMSSGIYYCQLKSSSSSQVKKMVLLR
ncbi:MAG: T9SS C-terminal target domain-containing protein, partial [Calditrichaeota bacterium]